MAGSCGCAWRMASRGPAASTCSRLLAVDLFLAPLAPPLLSLSDRPAEIHRNSHMRNTPAGRTSAALLVRFRLRSPSKMREVSTAPRTRFRGPPPYPAGGGDPALLAG